MEKKSGSGGSDQGATSVVHAGIGRATNTGGGSPRELQQISMMIRGYKKIIIRSLSVRRDRLALDAWHSDQPENNKGVSGPLLTRYKNRRA